MAYDNNYLGSNYAITNIVSWYAVCWSHNRFVQSESETQEDSSTNQSYQHSDVKSMTGGWLVYDVCISGCRGIFINYFEKSKIIKNYYFVTCTCLQVS